MRPVVGITTYVEPAAWGQWNLPAALIPLSYVQAVESAGYNIEDGTSCGLTKTGDHSKTDPMLSPAGLSMNRAPTACVVTWSENSSHGIDSAIRRQTRNSVRR